MAGNGVEDLIADLDELSEDEGTESPEPKYPQKVAKHANKRRKGEHPKGNAVNGRDAKVNRKRKAVDEDVMEEDEDEADDEDEREELMHKAPAKHRSHTYSPLLHSEEFQHALAVSHPGNL